MNFYRKFVGGRHFFNRGRRVSKIIPKTEFWNILARYLIIRAVQSEGAPRNLVPITENADHSPSEAFRQCSSGGASTEQAYRKCRIGFRSISQQGIREVADVMAGNSDVITILKRNNDLCSICNLNLL
jgi:hypothetical protein